MKVVNILIRTQLDSEQLGSHAKKKKIKTLQVNISYCDFGHN